MIRPPPRSTLFPYPTLSRSYSKGAWGLSVLPRGGGIFTATSISPSLRSRQRPSRYAVHARRNLPDKELRYLKIGRAHVLNSSHANISYAVFCLKKKKISNLY